MNYNNGLFNLEDVNLFYVFRAVFRNLFYVVLLAACGWMAVATYERIAFQPEYTSSVTFVVSTRGESNAFTNLSVTRELASIFGEIFQSDILMSEVKADLGKPDLNCKVSSNVVSETNLLTVTVTANTAEDAFRVLNSILDNYESISEYLLSNAILNVMKEPNVPMQPSNSKDIAGLQKKVSILAGIFGVLLIALLAAIRDTVQTMQGAKHKVVGFHFGNICHEEKSVALEEKANQVSKEQNKKKAALITNDLVSIHFLEDFRKLSARIEYYMKKHDGKILMVSSSSENEGKSTVVANLALALENRGKSVIVVDCDFRKPAIQKIFEVTQEEGQELGDWLESEQEEYQLATRNNIRLAVNFKNTLNPQKWITGERLFQFIQSLRDQADYIIVDTPPMLLAADAEALTRVADASLLVVRQDWTSIRDINDCMDFLEEGNANVIGYVLNDYEVTQGFRLSKNQLRSLFELPYIFKGKKEKRHQEREKTEEQISADSKTQQSKPASNHVTAETEETGEKL